jgi:hypothetical protein
MEIDSRHYEQRYVACSKPNCWCAKESEIARRAKAGHGPYWYRLIKKGKDLVRRYIGTELRLDPGKLRLDDPKDEYITSRLK